MRNILLFALGCLLSIPSIAQLSCSNVNASISLSASGGTVTLTNNSTPTSTNNIYTTYRILWGDNSSPQYVYNSNAAQTHVYHTSGTYTVTLFSNVLDSTNNISCNDTATANITVSTSLNCNNVNAALTTYLINNNTVNAGNNSSPMAYGKLGTQYTFVWGDGSSSTSLTNINQLHTYNSPGTYVVWLYSTWIDSNNNITCVDSTADTVVVGGGGGNLSCSQVNASFTKTVNGAAVTLTNTSTPNIGGNIYAQYIINWGDGNTTTAFNKTNHTHAYTSSGGYTIQLKAIYTDSVTTCVDSLIDSVSINTNPPNVIGGNIVTDSNSNNNRDTFKVWLITFDSTNNILAAVDSQIVSGFNFIPYAFNNKSAGLYRTKAHHLNGPTTGNGYIPTYHFSESLWSNANVIAHTGGTSAGKNIKMKKGTVTTGPGFIGGNVNQGANKGTANGIAGMNILLLDGTGNVITFAVTDANGAYSFPNLPNATYKIHPEDVGYATTAMSITIDANNTTHNSINFERSNSNHTITPKPAGITNVNAATSYTVYPNPAHNVVNITWAEFSKDVANISITDISGKKVYSNAIQMNSNTAINVQNLQSGFYFLNVATENGSTTQKLVIE